jgi:UDP-N-acetylglucosamine:LPS N-acetylglucosamine transferase
MGNGHLQVSHELARRLTTGGYGATVADLLALMPPPAGSTLRCLYPWLVNRVPMLYDRIYDHFFLASQQEAERASIPIALSLGGLRRLIGHVNPCVVVSTYHLAGVAAARLRAAGRVGWGTVTFITTFGVHDLWLHPGTDLYLCITPAAAAYVARRTGTRAAVCEPVVQPHFISGTAGCGAAWRGLRTVPGERIALIATGSLGLGAIKAAAQAVAAMPGWRPVVVCGHNQRLRAAIGRDPRMVALGWVDDMASLMAAADVVLDNAAGSTAKEALAVGCPVVTFRPLPGHGRHDAMMMAKAGLTSVTDDPAELAHLLQDVTSAGQRAAQVARGRALFGADPAGLIGAFADRTSNKLVA